MSTSTEQPKPARLILEVRWGPHAWRKGIVESGCSLRVGRAEPADFVIPDDARLDALHFELSWDGKNCRLTDLGSRYGTLLGGEHVRTGLVAHGDWLRAGRTDFSVYVESATAPPGPAAAEPESFQVSRELALKVLQQAPHTLFMLLDGARDDRIHVLLRESVESYRALYEGPQGTALAEVAPYLVKLPADSRLLRSLVSEGWGRHWGLFVCSDVSLKELSQHFRHFLMVRAPDERPLYFRFYDPRVLGPFLVTCAPTDALRFLGPVRALVMEGQTPEYIRRFRPSTHGISQDGWKLEPMP